MDVRQYAFLARLPSATVKHRDTFLGMPKRGIAFLLANVMFWQPMWAQADGIVVANPGTTLDRAGNGVQIINIATPNGSGLSHNQFHEYNVSAQGVILNNGANQASSTQLGGYIIDNPHLKNSGSAQAILNEVIGGSPSQLRGYTEVAGQSARVIVANPYGISCNGCGFINTPRVTLTTGKPVLDGAGRVDRYQVDQGSVSIDGAGLNANNIDRFEIITRSAKINAEIQAQNLTIVAGRNDVNAQTLAATARADDGSAKPQLAIDSSALGGMYAGAIKLVGTEAGVGVKLDGKLIASGGDIQLDANGQLRLAERGADADPQQPPRCIVGLADGGLHVARQFQHLPAARQDLVAGRSQAQLACGAVHQARTDPVFQLRQIPRHHRPGEIQMIGRRRLAAQIHYRDKHPHCLETIHDLPAFRNKLCLSIAFFVTSLATKLCPIAKHGIRTAEQPMIGFTTLKRVLLATATFGFTEAYHQYAQRLSGAAKDAAFAEGQASSRLYGATGEPCSWAEWESLLMRTAPALEESDILADFMCVMGEAPILPAPMRWLQRLLVRAAVQITPEPVRSLPQLRSRGLRVGEAALVRMLARLAGLLPLNDTPPAQAARRVAAPPSSSTQ